MFPAIHVYDGMLIGKDEEKMKNLHNKLSKKFKMTTMENPDNHSNFHYG